MLPFVYFQGRTALPFPVGQMVFMPALKIITAMMATIPVMAPHGCGIMPARTGVMAAMSVSSFASLSLLSSYHRHNSFTMF